jgi:hypothetical protein
LDELERPASVMMAGRCHVLAFDQVPEDHHARVAPISSVRTLRQLVAEVGHRHVGAVALDQLGPVILPGTIALRADDPDEREWIFAERLCSSSTSSVFAGWQLLAQIRKMHLTWG